MNFYQAGYFRQGVQGGNAGWGIVSPSRGMSRIAQEGFKGIAANLVELKNRAAMPTVNYGIFQYDRFTYILHVNYAAKGEDARGVVFVHGYCINSVDYHELCKTPEKVLNVYEENFQMEYDAAQEQYPVESELRGGPMTRKDLCREYGFTQAEYRAMVLRTLNALEGYADPLCIKIEHPSKGYMQTSRELVYLIMMGLPCHMRSRLSFFSYSGASCTVYVCGHMEGNNCIDLDERVFDGADYSRLQYEFTRIYNTYAPDNDEGYNSVFEKIADVMDDMFENPLQAAGCSQVEAAFQAIVKKNDTIIIPGVRGICPETVLELLYSFLKCDLKESETVYEYLGALLEVINDNSIRINDKRIVKRLSDGFDKTVNTSYRREICRLMASELPLGDRAEGFAELNRLSCKSVEQFEGICEILQGTQGKYFDDYYVEGRLPFILNTIGEIEKYLRTHHPKNNEFFQLLKILADVARREMECAEDLSALYGIAMKTNDLLTDYFPENMGGRVAPIKREIQFSFWERFDLAEFSPDDIDKYERMEVSIAAAIGWNGKKSENAEKTAELMKLFRNQGGSCDPRTLFEVLFTDKILADVGQKERIRDLLRTRQTESCDKAHTADADGEFDRWLAAFYDFKTKQFKTSRWITRFSDFSRNILEPGYVSRALEHSELMKHEELRKTFQESLAQDIRRAGREGMDASVLKGLKRYERCARGKKLKDDKDLEMQGRFADTLCRVPVGSLLLLAIGTLFRMTAEHNSHGAFGEATVLLAGIVFLVLFLAAALVKVAFMRGGFMSLMEDAGIQSFSRLVIYLIMAVLGLTGVVALLLVNELTATIIAAAVYFVIAVLGMVVSGILTKE